MPLRSISRRTDRRTDGVTDSQKTPVEAQSSLCSKTTVDSLKVTGAKGDLCPGSFVSTGAFAPVAPVESAPMRNTAPIARPLVRSAKKLTVVQIQMFKKYKI